MAIIFYALWAGLLLTTALVLRLGGRSERIGVLWLLANALIDLINNVSGLKSPTVLVIADGIYAVGLLPGAIYFVSWWIGTQTLLAAGAFLLEAIYLVLDKPADPFFVMVSNAVFAAYLINLNIASIGSAWSRRRKARQEELRSEPAVAPLKGAMAG